MNYTEDYLRKLTPGKWYKIADLPRVIGMAGIANACAKQILKPDFEIVLGRLGATFKIIRVQTETMRIIQRITA